MPSSRRSVSKAEYRRRLPRLRDELLAAQSQMRKAQTFAVAMIVSGVPAAGRTETVNELLEWLDPKCITVHAFGEPDREERQRPPMWRYWRTLPARGRIALYFAGWYSDYMGQAFRAPRQSKRAEERALARILQMETMLRADHIRVVKIHLHVDAKTQRERLSRLRADKLTRWRVTREDRWLARHPRRIQRVAARCIEASDHQAAPWHLIDGSDEEYRLLEAGRILRDEMRKGLRQIREEGRSARPRPQSKKISPLAAQPSSEMPKQEYQLQLETL